MKSPVVKRSIVIAGHKTSVSLEDAFWKGLKDIAIARQVTLSDLVASIDTERRHGNLSSAIRLFVLDHYQAQSNGRRIAPRPAQPPREIMLAPPRSAVGVAGGITALCGAQLSGAENLAGIENVERIERALDRAHGGERRLAVLGGEIFHLALTDAVLAGAGAVHRERARSTSRSRNASARLISSASLGSTSSSIWKLPSPTWPTIGAMKPAFARRRAGVALTHSASREIGTQTSDDSA